MCQSLRTQLPIWLKLRALDLLMWLDDRFQGHPTWRRLGLAFPQTVRAWVVRPDVQSALGLFGGMLLGFLIGWTLL